MVIIIAYGLIVAWFILVVFYNILSHEKYKQRQKFNAYIDTIYAKQPLVIERVHKPLILRVVKQATFDPNSENHKSYAYNGIVKLSYDELFHNIKKYVEDYVQVDNIKGEINVELKLTIYDRRPKWRTDESPSIRRIESSNNS